MSRKRVRQNIPSLPESLGPTRRSGDEPDQSTNSKRAKITTSVVPRGTRTQDDCASDKAGAIVRRAELGSGAFRMGAEKHTLNAIKQLADKFPLEKLNYRTPAIVLKHQLYTVQPSRTDVDKDIIKLFVSKQVRLFKLGVMTDEVAVVLEPDVIKHIFGSIQGQEENFKAVVERFLVQVMGNHRDVSIQANALKVDYNFNEDHITMLFNAGVLVRRDTLSYWLSLPDIGIFVKSFEKGRKETLGIINRAKGKEMLESMFLKRKLRTSVLSNEFHVSDIVGAELVKTSETASGTLLKLRRAVKQV